MQLGRQAVFQSGFALIEALIAMSLLGLGLLGLASAHMRTLANVQSSAYHLEAARLIEDLAERLRAHPQAQQMGSLLITHDWTQGDATAHISLCLQKNCNTQELAIFTRTQWLNQVASSLPGGKGHIFATSDPKLLGVMIGWRSRNGLLPGFANASDASAPCSPPYTCHLQYVFMGSTCQPIHSSACQGYGP